MDFHAAMETFAEAWVAANTQTAVNSEGQVAKPTPIEDLPTQLPRDQLMVTKTTTPATLPPAPPAQPAPPQLSPTSSSSSSSKVSNDISHDRIGQEWNEMFHTEEFAIVADTLINGTPEANRVDPDETAPTGAVSSSSTLFPNTSNHVTMREKMKEILEKEEDLEKTEDLLKCLTTGIKSLPIHCIIEQTNGQASFDSSPNEKSSTHNTVELDTYAILPGTTLLSECVRAALVKLGYNSSEALGAKGAIQLKNWRPLGFDTITDNKAATIDDILGELTQVSTLRIRICSAAKLTSAEEVKEKLLQLLLSQSHSLLSNVGCSGEKGYTNGQTLSTISPEMRRAFDRWYEEQLKNYTDSSNGHPGNMNLTMAAKELLAMQQERINSLMAAAHRGDMRSFTDKAKCLSPQISPPSTRPMEASTPTDVTHTIHPALQPHYLPGKTRMRTSFDPEHEIPRLQKWFADNQHPSRELMLQYLDELNSLDSRKGRRPLDLTNIIYWFKNARAAHRRATKNSEDDSFEMEDDKELNVSGSNENLPFLPNRNAVYMVPYPTFPNLGMNSHLNLLGAHSRFNGHSDYREPCDLSIGKRPESDTPKSVSSPTSGQSEIKDSHDRETEVQKDSLDVEIRPDVSPDEEIREKSKEQDEIKSHENETDENRSPNHESASPKPEEEEKVAEDLSVKQIDPHPGSLLQVAEEEEEENKPQDFSVERRREIEHHIKNEPEDLSHERSVNKPQIYLDDSPSDLSLARRVERPIDYPQLRPTDLTNGYKRKYESEDDMDSDDDDTGSLDRSSISSHDDGKIATLRESYLNAARGLNFNPVSSSPSSQPLHIPQFPHPLAMHYFPLNTHLYSQQANQLKYHNHQSHTQQTPPKSPTGHGQENSSHRKRRTRVFIDPLSEIPKLEKWFLDDTHPSSYMIDKYCEELNNSEYRQKFPKLEPKNVQLWFKNHRAKVKRMRIGSVGNSIMFD